jgi:hypothetical protein
MQIIRELYHIANKVADLAEVLANGLNFTSARPMAQFLGLLAATTYRLAVKLAENPLIEQRINALRHLAPAELLGDHTNTLRAVQSLGEKVHMAVRAASNPLIAIPPDILNSGDVKGWQACYCDHFARAGLDRNREEWETFTGRFREKLPQAFVETSCGKLPKVTHRQIRTFLMLEQAAAEHACAALPNLPDDKKDGAAASVSR